MRNFTTAAALTALVAALGACAEKPIYPVTQTAAPPPAPAPAPPPPPPSPPPAAGEDVPKAVPTAPIQSGNLAPLTTAPGAPKAEAYAAAPSPAVEAPATERVLQKQPGSGPVHTDTPEPIEVTKGMTLLAISRKTGLPVDELAKENGLDKPYRLHPGDSIKLPGKRYYTVQGGDTLYAIAHRFDMDAKSLAEFNDLKPGAGLRSGSKIYVPLEAKDRGAPKPAYVTVARRDRTDSETPPSGEVAVAPSSAEARPAATYAPPPATSTPPPATYAPPAAAATAPAASTPQPSATAPESGDADIAAAGRGLFLWPVRGEMIAPFGPKGAGRNDGIDLGATEGDSVRAAAAGEVVYAGSAVQGFGNLVLIKHPGGWVTAYAHLASIEVKMREAVTQGQEIGLVGQTGGVDRPQLHFEIRYAPSPKDKARPIDPMIVLPVQ